MRREKMMCLSFYVFCKLYIDNVTKSFDEIVDLIVRQITRNLVYGA